MSSNTKTGSASKIKMESFDDLFGGSSAQETGAEQIINRFPFMLTLLSVERSVPYLFS